MPPPIDVPAGAASSSKIYRLAGTAAVNGSTRTSAAARSALFTNVSMLAKDTQGNIYMADSIALYKLTANFATVQNLGDFPGTIFGVAVLADGTVLISRGGASHTICAVGSSAGIYDYYYTAYADDFTTCTTVAGTPLSTGGAFGGDGGPATSAKLNSPMRIAAHPTDPNKYYIADMGNNRIRMVSNGTITTVAGNGTAGFGGDGGPATSAMLNRPWAVAMDASGNLFIADSYNHRIRCVRARGRAGGGWGGRCVWVGGGGMGAN